MKPETVLEIILYVGMILLFSRFYRYVLVPGQWLKRNAGKIKQRDQEFVDMLVEIESAEDVDALYGIHCRITEFENKYREHRLGDVHAQDLKNALFSKHAELYFISIDL